MCYPDGYTAMRMSKQYKIPYVVTVRGTDLLTLKSYPGVRGYLFETLKKATRVIVPSERIKSQLGNFFPQIRSIVIPNGIDVGEFEHLNSIQMSGLEGKKIIVSVCNLNKDKGIEINVRAVAEIIKTRQDFHYIIVGDGAEGENLRSIVNELQLNSFVTFVGKQSHVKALEYINKSDVFSLPSWNETFGLVYLEAMYLKKPIVATFNDGIDGVALDGVHGYFAHKQNVPEVAEALKRLLSSEQLRIEMGSKGHEEVIKNYTWQKIAEKIAKIYQEVINE
jgi:glycosyltransferase involved in cell wall biosynthesis